MTEMILKNDVDNIFREPPDIVAIIKSTKEMPSNMNAL